MAANINRVIVTGNLTRDPETRAAGQTTVTSLRLAVNSSRKDQTTGQWVDKPNYFDVTVWGKQGENVAAFCRKGRAVAVDGRLDWREWQDKETGANRSAVQIVADTVQFLGGRDDGGNGGNGGGYSDGGSRFTPQSDVPADTGDFQPAGAGSGAGSQQDDDIPF